jgi:HlyD family secretion protein
VSKAELDQAEATWLRAHSAVRSSEHSIEIARANIVRAEKNLEFTTIVSSIDGLVIKLNSEVGEQVLGTFNNAGTVIMEIADLSTMLVKARVDETNIAQVKEGQRAMVHIAAYKDRTFPGVVELVGLKRELDRDGTGYFETRILVEQSPGDRLPSGATANAEIQVQTFAGVLKVPSQAVVDRRVDELPRQIVEGNPNVDKNKIFARVTYRVVDGKTVAVPVSIGSSDVTHTVIVSGLNEGDTVVTGPYKELVSIKGDLKVVDEAVAQKERDEKKNKDAKPVAEKKSGGGAT